MKHLKNFENHNSLEGFDDIDILKKANSIIEYYQFGPAWVDIIKTLNEYDVDYDNMNDLEIIMYYLENYDN